MDGRIATASDAQRHGMEGDEDGINASNDSEIRSVEIADDDDDEDDDVLAGSASSSYHSDSFAMLARLTRDSAGGTVSGRDMSSGAPTRSFGVGVPGFDSGSILGVTGGSLSPSHPSLSSRVLETLQRSASGVTESWRELRYVMRSASSKKVTGATASLIQNGLLMNSIEWVRRSITKGADTKAKDEDGVDIVGLAVRFGCDIGIVKVRSNGFRPIIFLI